MRRASVSALMVVLCMSTAHAAPSPAERLHDAALVAHRRGRIRQAIELWRDALKLEPTWKYAYNLSNSLYEVGDGEESWRYLATVDSLVPAEEKYAPLALELRSKVRALLYKDHALLALEIAPPDAIVTLAGARLEPPYELWLETAASDVRVTAPGHVPRDLQASHPIGERTALAVTLAPLAIAPARGTLRVDGEPAGARVTVNNVDRGVVPLALPFDPGPLSVTVSAPGYLAETFPVLIEPGQEAPLVVALTRAPTPRVATDLATPGWITIGGGVALAAIGTAFYFWADGTADDMRALTHADPIQRLDYRAYEDRYDALNSDFEDRRSVSQLFFVGAAVAAVTGVVLVLVDDTAADSPNVGLVPTTGGGLIVGGASF